MKAITRRQGEGRPADAKALAGLRRQAHFQHGDVAGWRGRSHKYVDRKREAAREACRKGSY